MIIVSGTKRSGTSMWMQLLAAAGFPQIGDAFPRNWASTIRDANPGGFWECELRQGIFYKTNPDPRTGTYLFPELTQRHAVKVFIPGLIKTDRAFIGKAIVTVRPWRQYVRSLNRLYAMERQAQATLCKASGEEQTPQVFMTPIIEWWVENFSLLSDIVTRRYPFYMVAYDAVIDSPGATLRDIFGWLGDGNVEAAITQVQPALRTQDKQSDDTAGLDDLGLGAEVIELFDSFYAMVLAQHPLTQSFVDRLNEVNAMLCEPIAEAVHRVAKGRLGRKRLLEERRRRAQKAPQSNRGLGDSRSRKRVG